VTTTSAGIWLLGGEERGSATSNSLETSLGMVRGNPERCRVFLLCVRFSLRRRIACLGWIPPQPMPRAASEDRPCMHEPTPRADIRAIAIGSRRVRGEQQRARYTFPSPETTKIGITRHISMARGSFQNLPMVGQSWPSSSSACHPKS
jgi:hypothetical protein